MSDFTTKFFGHNQLKSAFYLGYMISLNQFGFLA